MHLHFACVRILEGTWRLQRNWSLMESIGRAVCHLLSNFEALLHQCLLVKLWRAQGFKLIITCLCKFHCCRRNSSWLTWWRNDPRERNVEAATSVLLRFELLYATSWPAHTLLHHVQASCFWLLLWKWDRGGTWRGEGLCTSLMVEHLIAVLLGRSPDLRKVPHVKIRAISHLIFHFLRNLLLELTL